MADMSMAMQLATQPRGGLAQAASPQANPMQQGNPMAMAQQTTGQAQGFDNFAETVGEKEQAAQLGDQSFLQMVLRQLSSGLASQQELGRTRTQLLQRNIDLMQPTEQSGMDILAQGIISAGDISRMSVPEAFNRMGAGTIAAKQAYDKQEREKAAAAYNMVDKRIEGDENQAITFLKMMKELKGNSNPDFYLKGKPVFKYGTRAVMVDSETGKVEEVINAEKSVLGADTLYGKRAGMIEALAKEWLARAKYKNLEEATLAAEAEVDRLLANTAKATGVGPRPETPAAGTPAAGAVAAPAASTPAITTPAAPAETPTKPAAKPQVPTPPDFPKVTPEQQQSKDELGYDQLRQAIADASKAGDREAVEALQADMLKRFPNGKPKIGEKMPLKSIGPAPGATPKRDTAKEKMEESTAEGVGKNLAKEHEGLQNASAASAEMKMQLGTLRELYKTPNLPEGALAEKLQSMRSSLKSLGVDVGPEVGAADMINAIGGKMALLTRTADGSNLMPGAMSDFEQKILRSLAPGLQQTSEGRAALVDFLDRMADVRIRLAKEANEMAQANRGILPSDWYSRRDRILKEEQARMVIHSRELGNRFNKLDKALDGRTQ